MDIIRRKNYSFPIFIIFILISRISFGSIWTQKADFGGGNREQSIGFSIGNYGYAGTGKTTGGTGMNDLWQYDPSTNSWTQKADYPGSGRYGIAAFSVGNYGYAGTGWSGGGGGANQYNDFWQYDPASNSWMQKANFGGTARYSAVGLCIGNKGYIGLGFTPLLNDFWEYDPSLNTWTQKSNFPGYRQAAVGFGIGNKGYVGTGTDQTQNYNDFYEYDPATDHWTQKNNVPGLLRLAAAGFSVNGMGYIGMGASDTTYMTDFYQYDPATNQWGALPNIGGNSRYSPFAFSIGSYGYVGTGSYGGIVSPIPTNTFWRLGKCDGSALSIPEVSNLKQMSVSITADKTGRIILEYNLQDERDVEINLFNSLGEIILSEKLNPTNNHIYLQHLLSESIYFYSIFNESKILQTGKLIVN